MNNSFGGDKTEWETNRIEWELRPTTERKPAVATAAAVTTSLERSGREMSRDWDCVGGVLEGVKRVPKYDPIIAWIEQPPGP